MKRLSVWIGLALLTCVVICAGTAGEEKTSGTESTRVAALRREVSDLKARVDNLEKQVKVLKEMRGTVYLPESIHRIEPLPRGWGSRIINGMPFYIVPVTQDDAQPQK